MYSAVAFIEILIVAKPMESLYSIKTLLVWGYLWQNPILQKIWLQKFISIRMREKRCKNMTKNVIQNCQWHVNLYKIRIVALWNRFPRGWFLDRFSLNLFKSKANRYLHPHIAINCASDSVSLYLKWLLGLIQSERHCKK